MKKLQAFICDIDGTLALRGQRGPYEWDKVKGDLLNIPVSNIVNALSSCGYKVILVSGREDVCYGSTIWWLNNKMVLFDKLFMRASKDTRKDSIVKEEIYKKFIEPEFDVQFVLDDRDQVVEMWRNVLKLPCLQVAEGNF